MASSTADPEQAKSMTSAMKRVLDIWAAVMVERKARLGDYLKEFEERVDYDALVDFATAQRNGMSCKLTEDMNMGGNNVARVLLFEDGVRWIARIAYLRDPESAGWYIKSAVPTMRYLKEQGLPVPEVFAYDTTAATIGQPFILAEFIVGVCFADMFEMAELDPKAMPGFNEYDLPENFLNSLALFHVRLSNLPFKSIGRIVGFNEGEPVYEPVAPKVSKVYKSTVAYLDEKFAEWDQKFWRQFYKDRGTKLAAPPGPEDSSATSNRTTAPDGEEEEEETFPLVHSDLSYMSILFDEKYNLVGVVDWDNVHTQPWCIARYPEHLKGVPFPPDEYAIPGTEPYRYLQSVIAAENATGLGHKLSDSLSDKRCRAMLRKLRTRSPWHSY